MTLHILSIAPDQCFIGGQWVGPIGGETLPLSSPSDGTALCGIASGTSADIDAAVAAGQVARAGDWAQGARACESGQISEHL